VTTTEKGDLTDEVMSAATSEDIIILSSHFSYYQSQKSNQNKSPRHPFDREIELSRLFFGNSVSVSEIQD
jgi:predicted class III extradiol MEMO1 family dioxygenase